MLDKILALHKTLGVIFVCLLLFGVWLTYAIFTKKFADYDEVKLETSSVGLQLPTRADVKIRGVIVGEVLEMDTADEGGAELTLGIYPDELDTIPGNVTASIVPKTLFGEKYVSLVIPETGPQGTCRPATSSPRPSSAPRSRRSSPTSTRCSRRCSPADLNATLSALSTALEGRGYQLGENLEVVDSYLKRINPQIPALLDDLRLTAQVSDLYADILPEVAQILDDTVVTTGTLEEKEATLNSALRDIRAFSDTARGFLDRNGALIKEANQLTTTQLDLLARYSPEFPCVFKALNNIAPRVASMFRGFELHIVLETLPQQPRAYNVNDLPKFGDLPGPELLQPAQPAVDARRTRSPTSPTSTTASTSPPARAPCGSRRASRTRSATAAPRRTWPCCASCWSGSTATDADSDLGVLLDGPLVAEAGDR